MAGKEETIGASVRAKLLNKARAERADFQILLTRYALERLLDRLSVSSHRDEFVLEGAMLFVAWVAGPFNPSRGLDLLGRGDMRFVANRADVPVQPSRFGSSCSAYV
jgi:hypothetical protein